MTFSAKGTRSRAGHSAKISVDGMVVGEITYDSYHVNWNAYDSGIASALADYLSNREIKKNTEVAMEVAAFIMLYRAFGKFAAFKSAQAFREKLRPAIDGGRRRWSQEELLAEVIECTRQR